MATVNFKAVLGRQRDGQVTPRPPAAADATTIPVAAQGAADAPVSRTARLLALGYKVRRLLDSGALPDQREAAARLGIVFPQLTHILNLTYLSPRIQQRILAGELPVGEHEIRNVCRLLDWTAQHEALRLRNLQDSSTAPDACSPASST